VITHQRVEQTMAAVAPNDAAVSPRPWFLTINNTVFNHTTSASDLAFHHYETLRFTRIHRNGSGTVRGKIDVIMQGNLGFRFAEDISVYLREFVVVKTYQSNDDSKTHSLELWLSGDGYNPPRTYRTLPGEPILRSAETQVDPAPGVLVSTQPLADVIFTSSLSASLSNLSLGGEDNIAEQQATLDSYKRIIDSMLYRHEITIVENGKAITIPIVIGPLVITITVDVNTKEGTITASIFGISLGTAKFSLNKAAEISIDTGIAEASAKVWIQDQGIWLEAHLSVKPFGPNIDYGPKEIYHFSS
jgi:hypothetical protein